jgi:phage terminase large subunit-like protein
MPSKGSIVRRLNFCTWMESASPFVDPDVWRANGDEPDPDALEGVRCFGGLDLSGKNDLTALVLIFDVGEGPRPTLSFFWTPGDTLRQRQEKDRAPYDRWVEDGHLQTTPGKTIHYGWVARKLGELAGRYQIEAIAFDRWRSDDLIRELDDAGVDLEVVPHGQGFRGMSPSIESLEDDLIERRLMHGDHPVLPWCASNTRIVEDPAGLRKFDKRKSTGRIDGMVALAMAAGLMARDSGMKTVEHRVIFI